MHIKIQGGGNGHYANQGSSSAVISYLQHEDIEQSEKGLPEYFFNQDRDRVTAKEIVHKLDKNKARLSQKDSKFFVLTVSPSRSELDHLGGSDQDKSKALKKYIRDEVMQKYAEGFNKGLNASDIMYYAKIHHSRGDKDGDQMHAHIVISRKDMSNSKKLSPNTNHRSAKRSGTVNSGFDRTQFFTECEKAFDRKTEYKRDFKDSFEYLNTMKNGTIEEMERLGREVIAKEERKKKESSKREEKTTTEVSKNKVEISKNQESLKDLPKSKGMSIGF